MRFDRTIAAVAGLIAAPLLTAAAPDREAEVAKIVAGRTAGTPVDCVNLRDIRSTEIVTGTAIIYRMHGGTVYVNRPDGAGLLDRDDILVTRTITNRLCSIDIVQLADRSTRFSNGSVALGEFVPYKKPPRSRN